MLGFSQEGKKVPEAQLQREKAKSEAATENSHPAPESNRRSSAAVHQKRRKEVKPS